jgi:hypothetical protein
MRIIAIVAAALALAACSEGPPGSKDKGRKPSLTEGADEFMKVYGSAESGVTETTDKKPEERAPEEKK